MDLAPFVPAILLGLACLVWFLVTIGWRLTVHMIVALAFGGVALLIAVAIIMWAWRTVFG